MADTLSRLLYFHRVDDVINKLGGSELCCLETLFDCYRSVGKGAGEEGQSLPGKFSVS